MREKITSNGFEWELGRIFEVVLEHEFDDEDKAFAVAAECLDGYDAEAEMLCGGPCSSPRLILRFGDGCSIKVTRVLVSRVSNALAAGCA